MLLGGPGSAVVAGQGAIAVLLSNGREENTPLSPETAHGRMLGTSPHGCGSWQKWLQTHSSHESEATVLQEPLNLPAVLPLLTPHTE